LIWNHFTLQWTSGIRRAAFEHLASKFRLVLYDTRGQGLSDRGLAAPALLDQLDLDLDAVVARLDAERFILLGPSAFGLIAVRHAIRHPERVMGLVLWDYADAPPFAMSLLDMAEADWEYYLDTTSRNGFPTHDPSLVKQVLRESMTRADLLLLARTLRSSTAAELFPQVRVPALVLASRASARPGPYEVSSRDIAARIPGAKFQLLDGAAGGWEPNEDGELQAVAAIESFVAGLAPQPRATEGTLSSREIEVLRLIAAGRSNAQIAEALVISPNTVGRHVSNIFDKIGAANRAEATAYALRQGIA
jgi:DNA-binding CsgD family transcriptional regulator/pimeloyl-ACP methyl ester carboxylesterase